MVEIWLCRRQIARSAKILTNPIQKSTSNLGKIPRIILFILSLLIFQISQTLPCEAAPAEDNVAFNEAKKSATDCFKKGNIQAAFNYCNRALELNPKSADALLIRGWLLLNANKPDRAVEEFNKVLEVDPKNVNAYKSRGLVYRQLKEFERSTMDLDKAKKLDPTDVEANYLHAMGDILNGNHELAIQNLNTAIKYGSNHPRLNHLYYWRGRTRQMLEDHKGAIEDLTKCLDLSCSNFQSKIKPDPKYDLSTLFFRVSIYTEKSDSIFGQLERAQSYLALGDYARAAEDYTAVLALNPEDVIMYEERGYAYLLDGQYQKSLKDFNRALLHGSHSTDLYLRMAAANYCLGKYDRVPGTLETWFKREGYVSQDSPLAIALSYSSYIRTKNFKEAHLFLKKVGAKIPAKEAWHLKCFLVLKKSLCCSGLMKAASKPTDKAWSQVHFLAGNFYTLTNSPAKARKQYQDVMLSADKRSTEMAVARQELKRIQ